MPADERCEWQMRPDGIGEAGQEKLRHATVLISRIGGVGGTVAQSMAMAGVGRLILAHAGSLQLTDLNRQSLMSVESIGRRRLDIAAARLRQLNPDLELELIPENLTTENVDALVARADIVGCCAPVFDERYAMNAACVRLGKPLVHAAMHDFEVQVGVFHSPGPCLRCVFQEPPAWWGRRFPVFGAVAHTAGALAAVEIIKLLTAEGEPLTGQLLTADLRRMDFRRLRLHRDPQCPVCGDADPATSPPQATRR